MDTFTFENERRSFDFKGTYDIFTVEGTCMFIGDKLLEVTASIYVPGKNPATGEDVTHIGTASYNSHLEDRTNYNVYIAYEYVKQFMTVLPDIISELEKSKE